MGSTAAIVVAAGRGTRFGAPDKILLPLGGRPLLAYSLDAFEASEHVDAVVIVAGDHTVDRIRRLVGGSHWTKVYAIGPGGERRQDSVAAGLKMVPGDCSIVVVHDGARPLITPDLIDSCVAEAGRSGAAILAVPVSDTLKFVEGGTIRRTVSRSGMWSAQTPQAMSTALLRDAFGRFGADDVTDEASLLEALGVPVAIVPGSPRNLKVTSPDDLVLAEALLGSSPAGSRR